MCNIHKAASVFTPSIPTNYDQSSQATQEHMVCRLVRQRQDYLKIKSRKGKRRQRKKLSQNTVYIMKQAPKGNFIQGDVSSIPTWNFSVQARTGGEKFTRTKTNTKSSLRIILRGTNIDGTKATKNSLVTSRNGSVIWGQLPDLPSFREAGLTPGPIIMRYGNDKTGFMHIVLKHCQWIMDAIGVYEPVEAATIFIESVLEHVEKLHKDSKPNAAILKNGEKERYYIVIIGADAIDKSFYKIKTAFVAKHENRFDYLPNLIDEDDSLRLRIPVSSLGESQRLRVPTEQQSLNSEQPVTAEPSSTQKLPHGSQLVKDISYSINQNSQNFSAVETDTRAT